MAEAEPSMDLEFVVANRVELRTEEMAALQLDMWRRAEAAVAAYADAQGDEEIAAARTRLRSLVNYFDAAADMLAAMPSTSKRNAAMWRLAVDEILEFAADAIARRQP
jgi:siroheme synthase (precorrin-2 oxidase/ferrochelatase)